MSIRNSNIELINTNQGGSSFYPSQFASFCEMGNNISELIFKNRLSDEENNKSQNSSNNRANTNNNINNTLKNDQQIHTKNRNKIEYRNDADSIKHIRVT